METSLPWHATTYRSLKEPKECNVLHAKLWYLAGWQCHSKVRKETVTLKEKNVCTSIMRWVLYWIWMTLTILESSQRFCGWVDQWMASFSLKYPSVMIASFVCPPGKGNSTSILKNKEIYYYGTLWQSAPNSGPSHFLPQYRCDRISNTSIANRVQSVYNGSPNLVSLLSCKWYSLPSKGTVIGH